MEGVNYTYVFDDLSDIGGDVKRFGGDTAANVVSTCKVAVDDRRLLSLHRVPEEIVADLIDLAVAVYVADRLSIRKVGQPRRIQVVVPVRCPEILGSPRMSDQLRNILYWFTHDHWSFDFTRRNRRGRTAELQMPMPLDDRRSQPATVALWSGGLDSLAGLFNCLSVEPSGSYILLGTGSNTILHHTQRQVAVRIRGKFPDRIRLLQIPIWLAKSSGVRKERSQRTRGFVFMLLGAACAYLAGKMTLHLYENGIGAINLPFRASEVGLDHTRSVHPLSLFYMSNLLTELLGVQFSVQNPFLFYTKAMMCRELVEASCVSLAFDTISCDRLRREKPMQCGYCSSCILRRQALAVHGVDDRISYSATTRSVDNQSPQWPRDAHRLSMLHQVNDLRAMLSTQSPWQNFVYKYPSLAPVVDRLAPRMGIAPEVMSARLLGLYQAYVDEWDSVRGWSGDELSLGRATIRGNA